MAEKISAEGGALRRGAGAVRETRDAIDGRVRAVDGAQLDVRSHWSGPAAAQYFALIERWEAEARKINRVLESLEASLLGTESDQAASDESHRGVIGNLSSMMG